MTLLYMLFWLVASMLLWAGVAGVITYLLHLCALYVSFWCVYSFVLIGTIVYYRLKDPWACPIK